MNIDIIELKLLIKDQAVELIDIREPDEFVLIHCHKAKLIPFGELVRRQEEINWDKTVVLFCRTGWRSQRAIEALKEYDKEAISLNGGIKACYENQDFDGWVIDTDPNTLQEYFK